MSGTAVEPAWGTMAPGADPPGPPPLRTRYGGAVAALVIGADRAFAAALTAALVRHGMRVETAQNALEALYALEHETPDLIVLDLDQPADPAPAVSGHRFARHLRQDPVTRALPLVVLTSLSFQEAAETLRGGADAFLEKPVAAATVAARARELAERDAMGPGTEQPAGWPGGRAPTATRAERWLQARAGEVRRPVGRALVVPEAAGSGHGGRDLGEAERRLDRAWRRLQWFRSAASPAWDQSGAGGSTGLPACLYRRALEDVRAACAALGDALEPESAPTPRQRFTRWLVQTGRLSDDAPGPLAPPAAGPAGER